MGYTQIYYLAASLPTYIKYLYTKKIRYRILFAYFIGFYDIVIVLKRIIFGHTDLASNVCPA